MKRWIEANSWTLGLAVLLAALLLATKLIQPGFGASGLDSLARAALPFALATVGMAIVVLAGGIDLSIAAMMAVASVTGAVLTQGATDAQSVLIVLFVLVVGLAMGAINGFLIVHEKLEGFIITLGMGILLKGVALQMTDAHPISADLSFNELADGYQMTFGLTKIPNMVIIMLLVVLGFSLILRYTQFGRNIYAIGGDYAVAEYSGIPVMWQKWFAFVLSSLLTTLAGIVNSSHLGAGNANYGDMTAMIVNCAVVVGGTSMAGGIGGIWQSAIGVLFFSVLEFSLNTLVPNAYVIMLIEGLVIVAILFLDSYDNKRKRERV